MYSGRKNHSILQEHERKIRNWPGQMVVSGRQAMETIRIIDAKDVEGLSVIEGSIDAACEGCHLQFWYPLK